MAATNSVSLLQNPSEWQNQTTASRDTVSLFGDLRYQTKHTHALKTIAELTKNTHDGGVRLNHNDMLMWSIYMNANSISRILPKVNLKNEIITKPAEHTLVHGRVSIELPLDAIRWIENTTGLTQDRIGRLMGVTRQALSGWKRGKRIADDNCQRIFAVRDVIERAVHQYPNQAQLIAWLDTPRGSDGHTPAELLAANEINRVRLLAVSSPSPRLANPPSWVRKAIPEKFFAGAEHRQEVLPPETDSELTKLIKHGEYGIDEDGEVFPLA